jgi:polyphenol oxidase
MVYLNKNGLVLARFQFFSQQPGLLHFVSTRQGGVSTGAYAGLNLSYREPDRENAVKNRRLLAQALEIDEKRLIFPGQCHSDTIKIVDKETIAENLWQTDGLVTSALGLCIGVLVADCVPVLVYDTKKHVAGVVHAGWRGTVSSITAKIIEVLVCEFNSNPAEIIAAIGPSISPDNYEVGEDVIEQIEATFKTNHGLVKPSGTRGKGFLDLWKANKLLLMEMGVPESNIETAGICTFSNTNTFYSARRLGINSGRFGAGIMLNP